MNMTLWGEVDHDNEDDANDRFLYAFRNIIFSGALQTRWHAEIFIGLLTYT